MDNRPIGIMDSGVGGLTVAKALHDMYPKESIVFIGDSKRNPYGERTREEIADFGEELKAFLLARDVKMLIVGCNTISFNVRDNFTEGPVPVVKMSLDISFPKGVRKVGIFATPASIATHAHYDYLSKKFPEIHFTEVPCDGVAAAIEQKKEENLISSLVRKAVKEYHACDIDAGYWACTHYPLVPGAFEKALPHVPFIDPARPTVERAVEILRDRDALADKAGENRFYFTDCLENASPLVRSLFSPVVVEKTVL